MEEITNPGRKTLQVSSRKIGVKEVVLSWQPQGKKSLWFILKIKGEPGEPWGWAYPLARDEPIYTTVRLGILWGLKTFADLTEEVSQAFREWADGI